MTSCALPLSIIPNILSQKVITLVRHHSPLVDPCWLFPIILFSFMALKCLPRGLAPSFAQGPQWGWAAHNSREYPFGLFFLKTSATLAFPQSLRISPVSITSQMWQRVTLQENQTVLSAPMDAAHLVALCPFQVLTKAELWLSWHRRPHTFPGPDNVAKFLLCSLSLLLTLLHCFLHWSSVTSNLSS